MTKLDYEPKRPKPRRRGPDLAQVLLWIVSCMSGAIAGSAVSLFALFSAPPLAEIGCCGLIGGAVSVIAAVPLLVFMEDKSMLAKLLMGGIVAFVLTAGAVFILVEALGTA